MVFDALQDTYHRENGNQGRLLGIVGLTLAVATGAFVPLGMLFLFGDRLLLMLVALGSVVFSVAALWFPVALVLAIILYESLLSWQDASQLQLFGYNRLLFYAVTAGGFSLALLYNTLLRKRSIRLRWIDVALALYVAVNLVAALTSVDVTAARSGFTYLLATSLCFYTARLVIRTSRHSYQTLFVLIAFMVFEGALGGIQYLTGQGVLYVTAESGGDFLPRATGTLGNGLGWYLSVGYIITLNLWLHSSRRLSSWLYLAALVIIVGGLFSANTRGAWVDCAIATMLSVIPVMKTRIRKVFWLFLAASLVLVVILSNASVQQRVASIVYQISNPAQTTVGFRFYVWRAALDMFEDRPLLGVGPDNFGPLLPNYLDREGQVFLRVDSGVTYSVHHAGLQILAETGILGALAFSLFALAYLREALWLNRHIRSTNPGLGMALLVFAVMSILSMLYGGYAFGGYTQIGRIFFVVAGLTLAQVEIIKPPRATQPAHTAI